jgi:hypothetical protein
VVACRNAAALADENLRNRAAAAGIAIVDKPLVGNRLLDSIRKALRDKASLRKTGLTFLRAATRRRSIATTLAAPRTRSASRATTSSTICFPKTWPTDRELRARIIGEWLTTEAGYLAS